MTKTHTGAFPYYVEDYLAALHDSALLAGGVLNATFEIEKGQKYLKVIELHNGRRASVHAFIESATGALIKAASWKAPQRNSDGTLAIRYDLTDDTVRAGLCERLRSDPSAIHGGYLYKR